MAVRRPPDWAVYAATAAVLLQRVRQRGLGRCEHGCRCGHALAGQRHVGGAPRRTDGRGRLALARGGHILLAGVLAEQHEFVVSTRTSADCEPERSTANSFSLNDTPSSSPTIW